MAHLFPTSLTRCLRRPPPSCTGALPDRPACRVVSRWFLCQRRIAGFTMIVACGTGSASSFFSPLWNAATFSSQRRHGVYCFSRRVHLGSPATVIVRGAGSGPSAWELVMGRASLAQLTDECVWLGHCWWHGTRSCDSGSSCLAPRGHGAPGKVAAMRWLVTARVGSSRGARRGVGDPASCAVGGSHVSRDSRCGVRRR